MGHETDPTAAELDLTVGDRGVTAVHQTEPGEVDPAMVAALAGVVVSLVAGIPIMGIPGGLLASSTNTAALAGLFVKLLGRASTEVPQERWAAAQTLTQVPQTQRVLELLTHDKNSGVRQAASAALAADQTEAMQLELSPRDQEAVQQRVRELFEVSAADLKILDDSADSTGMPQTDTLELDNALPDGELELPTHDFGPRDVARLIELGAPAWMIDRAKELVDE